MIDFTDDLRAAIESQSIQRFFTEYPKFPPVRKSPPLPYMEHVAKRIVDAVTVSDTITHSLLALATLSNLPECPFARGKAASSIKLRTERLRDTDSIRNYDIPWQRETLHLRET